MRKDVLSNPVRYFFNGKRNNRQECIFIAVLISCTDQAKKEAHTLRSSAETSVSNADSVVVVTAVLIRQEAPCYLLPYKEARREQTTE